MDKSRQARGAAVPLLGLAFVGFISLGLPDGLLGVGWPSIRQTFGLPLDALGALLLTMVVGYLAASSSSGWVVARLGVGRLLALSSLAFGRLLFGFVANRVDPVLLVRACLLAVLAGAALIWRAPSEALGFIGLGLIGLAEAPIFPSLVASTPRRVGPGRATAVIGFQVGAAGLGVAVLPGAAGLLAERFGLEVVGPVLVLAALTMLLLHEAIVARAA